VRTVIGTGKWSHARLEVGYGTGHIVEEDTITLLWYDSGRALWVPATGQRHDRVLNTVEGDMPSGDVVMVVFGRLSEENVNTPPNLVITFDVRDAYQGERMRFDASSSTDPENTTLIFHWDLTDDGEPGPWIPGTAVYHVYERKGVHQVVLRAEDGGNLHYKYENVTIRAEKEYRPGPWDNPGALFLLASLLVIAFGLAGAFRLHRPRSYEDIYGKAYRQKEDDEYSQLFRKLTEAELRGHPPEEDGPGEDGPGEGTADEDGPEEDGPGEDGGTEEEGPPPEGDGDDEEEAPR